MWSSGIEFENLDSEDDSVLSSEEEQDIQCEILEKQRDEANQRLCQMEEASVQLLKEINMLEIQFGIERSCRENAEAFALKVTKENKVLKRKSQALLPLIPEIPENLAVLKLEEDTDSDFNASGELAEEPLLKSQAQIRELQSSVDQLLGEKMQLCEQVEVLKKEKEELKEQLAVEVQEKEAILMKLTKQSRTVNKMKRVSQLVTEEFAEMSQKLEMEQGLRHHAEKFAHQVLVKQKESQRQSLALVQNEEVDSQLQQAFEQMAQISKALEEIRLHYQHKRSQSQAVMDEFNALTEMQMVRAQLETKTEEKMKIENQLRDSEKTVTALQEKVKQLQDMLKMVKENPHIESDPSNEVNVTPAQLCSTPPPSPPPPPPPPPPPVLFKSPIDPLDALRNRKKSGSNSTNLKKPAQSVDVKARAVDEMMERIKKGIVLKPTQKPSQTGLDEDSWKDQRAEKRRSAVLELQGILDTIKKPGLKRMSSRKRISRNVGEAELQIVLQRRRRAIGDDTGASPTAAPKNQDPPATSTATSSSNWLAESGNTPVLRRLKQNQEKRNSRIRASECIIWEDK
ncbi:shootin-1 [Clarias gariepinus]|uniref:shootin-1 n=1 Tax=Clarias gariepinus TaxID=13013 RepID=UPI00234C81C8|nr:shootin-1 [Clarias gariepinus]